MAARLTPEVVRTIVGLIPESWLAGDAGPEREAYEAYLLRRLEPPRPFLDEAVRARGGG